MEFETLIAEWGLEWKTILTACPLIVIFIAFLKDRFGLKGKEIIYFTAGVSFVVALMKFYNDPIMLIPYTPAFFIGSTGGVAFFKKMAHKMGTPSTKEPD